MDRRDATGTTDRRAVLKGGAAMAAMITPAATFAQKTGDTEAIRKAVVAGHSASVKRIQDWIANPTIAAEKLNVDGDPDEFGFGSDDAGAVLPPLAQGRVRRQAPGGGRSRVCHGAKQGIRDSQHEYVYTEVR